MARIDQGGILLNAGIQLVQAHPAAALALLEEVLNEDFKFVAK